MVEIKNILAHAVEREASDVHINAGLRPIVLGDGLVGVAAVRASGTGDGGKRNPSAHDGLMLFE